MGGMTKRCPACLETKPVSEFGVHSRKKDGLRTRCKECERKPPRVGLCGACGSKFTYKRRGPEARICATCQAAHHWCHVCKAARPHGDFFKQSGTPTGLSYKCRECTRLQNAVGGTAARTRKAQAVKDRYGITLDEYEAHFARAAGRCECCGRERYLVLDHSHVSGEVRGVLCSGCNTGIGLLGDTALGLLAAINYLAPRDPDSRVHVLRDLLSGEGDDFSPLASEVVEEPVSLVVVEPLRAE